MPDIKKCKHCNKEFEAVEGIASSFCSEECRKAHKAKLRKARRPKQARGQQKLKTKKTNQSKTKPLNKPEKRASKGVLKEVVVPKEEKKKVELDLDALFPEEVWEQRPVDIETFLFDRNYLGSSWLDADGNRTMFPFWQEMSKKIFPLPMKSPYNTVIFSGATGLGKQMPNFCKILTPTGYTTHGKVKIGDEILGIDGKPQKVVGVFPQGKQPVAKITFNDGSEALAGYEHLWTIQIKERGKIIEKVLTTQEIIDKYSKSFGKANSPWLPRIQPIEYSQKNFLVEPYTMGSSMGASSTNKSIPEEYLYGSIQQRLDLLRGIMDTHGFVIRKACGGVKSQGVYSTTSKALAEGVARLARSLGMFASIKEGHIAKSYKVTIDSDTFCPFLMDKRASLWTSVKQSNREFRKIEYYGEEECTCIKVSNPDEMYLTNDYIPTHNTSVAMGVCLAYYLHIVLCLRNPHKYFGLADQKNIVFAVLNIVTKQMAYKNAWGMLHKMLLNSPWFMARGVKSDGKRPEWTCTTKPVELIFGRNADDLIGLDILCAFMDEISFYRNASIESQIKAATDVYNAAWERMKSRFVKFGGIFDGLMVLASSKRTDQSFLEGFIKKITESQDSRRVLVIDKPRWEVLPPESYCGKRFPVAVGDKFRPSQIIREDQVQEFTEAGYKIYWPPIENYGEFERDMNNALTNIAGISVGQISSFLRGDLVTSCVNKELINPFRKSIIHSGFKDPDQYYEYFDTSVLNQEDFTLPLFVHLDASLGRDGNSIVGVVADYAINQKNLSGNYQPELHYRELFKIKVRAPQGTETGLDKNTKFIIWLSQRFNLQAISHDQFQSKNLHQDLVRNGVNVVQQSVDAVKDGINPVYAVFKDVLYEKRVSLLDDEDQLNELVSLEKYENGKVDKPQGGTDDVSQCLAGAVYLASQAKEEMLASGVVLLKQLDSSESVEVNSSLPPEKLIEKEMEKHFAAYSPEAIRSNQQSSLHSDWEKFFGKDKKKDSGQEGPVNPGMYWG